MPAEAASKRRREDEEPPARAEAESEEAKAKRKRRRWDSSAPDGDAVASAPSAPPATTRPGFTMPDVNALKAQTQARLAEAAAAMAQFTQSQKAKQWAPLLLDKHGRQVDESGKVVVLEKEIMATLKVNLRTDEPEKKAARGSLLAVSAKEAAASGTHMDPRMEMPKFERERRSMRFVKPGKYIARAQTLRLKQISKEMRSHQFETTEEGTVRRQMTLEPIPNVEWWDELLLESDSYDAKLKPGAITNMVHVPIILDPVSEAALPPPMQMMLTVKERKKIKRIKKTEKQKEEQDKIRLGLIQAPEPKMRLSNLMRVLGNEAIMEPSRMEAKVRKQMGERQAKHREHNEARQLTAEQKREKKRKKLTEETNVEVHLAVFRAGDLTDGRRRFKVDIHAQQYNLTGATVIYGNCNVVVVEGGPKGIKKFTKLMMNRIKWMPDDELGFEEEEEEENSDEEGGNVKKVYRKCALVWQGVSHKRTFRAFRFEHCRSEQQARQIFKDKNVPQYWDMCRNYNDQAL